MDLTPLIFEPILQQRPWGGRSLGDRFGRAIPLDQRIGESWEIVDRVEAVSVVARGPLKGRTLSSLIQENHRGILGNLSSSVSRFPWLCKLLDAREVLSVQVHPPLAAAVVLGGEPKTEMWYVVAAEPDSKIYAGWKSGINKHRFLQCLELGTVAECLHEISVKEGDVVFMPSGRVHALGAGICVFEIQQNSDTTYRVYDWNRKGLDGKPRSLHLDHAFQCFDFTDVEPELVRTLWTSELSGILRRRLVQSSAFDVDEWRFLPVKAGSQKLQKLSTNGTPKIIAIVRGQGSLVTSSRQDAMVPGDFWLIPAGLNSVQIVPEPEMTLMIVSAGESH